MANYVNKKFTPKQDPNYVWGNDVRGTNLVIGTDMAAAGYSKHFDETEQLSSTPSDDLRTARFQYVDSTKLLGHSAAALATGGYDYPEMQMTFQSGNMIDDAARASKNHLEEFSQCETLGLCSAPELKMGSPCESTDGNRHGFCYEAAGGTLECGRTIATISHFGVSPVSTEPGAVIVPCPRHCPSSMGSPTGMVMQCSRLPYVGCMISTDANYNKHATFHVPSTCATPADYKPGCPLAGALNFVPGAKQVTTCMWNTGGCTDSDAANFDPTATISDGSCIAKIEGCPIAEFSYAGVDKATPGFKSLYHDDKASIEGATGRYQTAMPDAKNVVLKPEDPKNANWYKPGSCTVAIEGCMDSNAANYDPVATINSKTWCVPKVEGCMDPDALNFSPLATIHIKTMCEWKRSCAAGVEFNAELVQPKASVFNTATPKFPQTLCWDTAIGGCLDPYALNYGCEYYGVTPCIVGEAAFAGPQGDDYTKWAIATSSQGVVFNEPAVCFYQGASTKTMVAPTLSALLQLNPDSDAQVVVTTQFSMNIAPCDVTPAQITAIAASYAKKFNVPVEDISVSVLNADSCGRRRLASGAEQAVIRVGMLTSDNTKAQQISDALAAQPLTKAVITAMLKEYPEFLAISDFGVTSDALTTYTFKGTYVDPSPPPSPPPPAPPPSAPSKSDNTGAIVGGVIGGIILLLLCAAGIYYYKKKQNMKTTGVYPA